MTLAEQGAYRNLLDELWVRGGVLPNDERILAKISGDALAWPTVRAVVMRHFYKADGGLRNSTHDEVSAESVRRARKQKDWRDRNRTGNAHGNGSGNEGHNVTPSPGPGPGPSKGKGKNGTEPATGVAPVRALARASAASWSGQALDDYRERYGAGSGHAAQIGAGLKPLVLANTWVAVRAAWRRYLGLGPGSGTTHPSPSAQNFAACFADWLPAGRGPETGARTPGVISTMLAGRALAESSGVGLERHGNGTGACANGAAEPAAEDGGRGRLKAAGG